MNSIMESSTFTLYFFDIQRCDEEESCISESRVIRDSDSSQKGVLDIFQRSVKHFNN